MLTKVVHGPFCPSENWNYTMDISGKSAQRHRGLTWQDPRWLPKSTQWILLSGCEQSSVKSPQPIFLVSQHDRCSGYMAILMSQINHGVLLWCGYWCLCALTLRQHTPDVMADTPSKLDGVSVLVFLCHSSHCSWSVFSPQTQTMAFCDQSCIFTLPLDIILLPGLKSVVSKSQ